MNKSTSRWHSLRFAFSGIKTIIHSEKNTWIYIPISIVVVVLGFLFKIELYEWLGIVICLGLVWAFEAANTALEALVDLTSPEIHPIAKIAKDCSAAAVLITAITSAIIGLIVFLPRILHLLGFS